MLKVFEECHGVATLVVGYVAMFQSSSFPSNDVSLRSGDAWVKSYELTIALAGVRGCHLAERVRVGRKDQGRVETRGQTTVAAGGMVWQVKYSVGLKEVRQDLP